MATERRRTGRKAPPAPSASPAKSEHGAADFVKDGIIGLTGSIKSLAGQVVGLASAATDLSLGAGGLLLRSPEQREVLRRTGEWLRGVREGAGMTVADLGRALDLEDPELLELAEGGKAALPTELVLRMAAVLARNDPVPFVMNLMSAYSPAVMRALEAIGIGRLVEHARREREFINLYRSRDQARHLSEDEFERMLAFVGAALDLALEFRQGGQPPDEASAPERRPRRGRKTGR